MTIPLSALASNAPASMLHDVHMEIAGRPFSMIGTAELTPGSLTIAAVTSVGGRLFVIQYDGSELRYEPSHLFNVPIKAERMLRDFFLIYGRTTALVAYGLDVRQQDAGRRIVTRNGERINLSYTDIDHVWTSDVQYRNRRLGYSITISPIPD